MKEFQKYKKRGAYHWEQISKHPVKRNSFVLARYLNVVHLLENTLGTLENKRILDVGCGDGVLTYFLAKKGAITAGIDLSEIAIEFAKSKLKKFNIDFKVGSAYTLPYNDNSFDAVVSSDVIEHLEDVNSYLLELKRVTKKGGGIIISTPIRYTAIPLDNEHVVEWFTEEFKEVITRIFPHSQFYCSHPLVWKELYEVNIFGKPYFRVIINLMSFLRNPFCGFKSRFKLYALQYSVSRKVEGEERGEGRRLKGEERSVRSER